MVYAMCPKVNKLVKGNTKGEDGATFGQPKAERSIGGEVVLTHFKFSSLEAGMSLEEGPGAEQ